MTDDACIDRQLDALRRGCEGMYTVDELRARLIRGKPLRVKLGMDPTAPDLTLGHVVVLRKLRQFQDLGHKAVLIIGDYTARIGDPTGRSKTRPTLTADEIQANADTYLAQAGKVIDVSPDKLEIRCNSEWLAKLSCADVVQLMSRMTVARMLERDTFATRRAAGKEIFLHELLYPLMQARDSVEIKADVELGGTDQTFNNLCGRDLQRAAGQPPQIVMVVPILVGTDGHDKMSKSLGNYVGVTDAPSDMFGKVMRIPDALMASWFGLLTDVAQDEIDAMCDAATHHPRDTKERLAKLIVSQFHTASAADAAAEEFARVHGGAGGGGLPDDVPDVSVPADLLVDGTVVPIDLITHCGFATSRVDAKKLVAQGGVRLNGTVIADAHARVAVRSGDVLQRGKRAFARLTVVG
ncbi:MAG: tyrosine--tRNA ligase [Phycisphaerae bacterium]